MMSSNLRGLWIESFAFSGTDIEVSTYVAPIYHVATICHGCLPFWESLIRKRVNNLVPSGVQSRIAIFFLIPRMPRSIVTPGSVTLKYPNVLDILISPVVDPFCV